MDNSWITCSAAGHILRCGHVILTTAQNPLTLCTRACSFPHPPPLGVSLAPAPSCAACRAHDSAVLTADILDETPPPPEQHLFGASIVLRGVPATQAELVTAGAIRCADGTHHLSCGHDELTPGSTSCASNCINPSTSVAPLLEPIFCSFCARDASEDFLIKYGAEAGLRLRAEKGGRFADPLTRIEFDTVLVKVYRHDGSGGETFVAGKDMSVGIWQRFQDVSFWDFVVGCHGVGAGPQWRDHRESVSWD